MRGLHPDHLVQALVLLHVPRHGEPAGHRQRRYPGGQAPPAGTAGRVGRLSVRRHPREPLVDRPPRRWWRSGTTAPRSSLFMLGVMCLVLFAPFIALVTRSRGFACRERRFATSRPSCSAPARASGHPAHLTEPAAGRGAQSSLRGGISLQPSPFAGFERLVGARCVPPPPLFPFFLLPPFALSPPPSLFPPPPFLPLFPPPPPRAPPLWAPPLFPDPPSPSLPPQFFPPSSHERGAASSGFSHLFSLSLSPLFFPLLPSSLSVFPLSSSPPLPPPPCVPPLSSLPFVCPPLLSFFFFSPSSSPGDRAPHQVAPTLSSSQITARRSSSSGPAPGR